MQLKEIDIEIAQNNVSMVELGKDDSYGSNNKYTHYEEKRHWFDVRTDFFKTIKIIQ